MCNMYVEADGEVCEWMDDMTCHNKDECSSVTDEYKCGRHHEQDGETCLFMDGKCDDYCDSKYLDAYSCNDDRLCHWEESGAHAGCEDNGISAMTCEMMWDEDHC